MYFYIIITLIFFSCKFKFDKNNSNNLSSKKQNEEILLKKEKEDINFNQNTNNSNKKDYNLSYFIDSKDTAKLNKDRLDYINDFLKYIPSKDIKQLKKLIFSFPENYVMQGYDEYENKSFKSILDFRLSIINNMADSSYSLINGNKGIQSFSEASSSPIPNKSKYIETLKQIDKIIEKAKWKYFIYGASIDEQLKIIFCANGIMNKDNDIFKDIIDIDKYPNFNKNFSTIFKNFSREFKKEFYKKRKALSSKISPEFSKYYYATPLLLYIYGKETKKKDVMEEAIQILDESIVYKEDLKDYLPLKKLFLFYEMENLSTSPDRLLKIFNKKINKNRPISD